MFNFTTYIHNYYIFLLSCTNSFTKAGDIISKLNPIKQLLIFFKKEPAFTPELQELYKVIDDMLDDSGYPKDLYYYQLNQHNDE